MRPLSPVNNAQLPKLKLEDHPAGGRWLWQKIWNLPLWPAGKRLSLGINQLPYGFSFGKKSVGLLCLGLCAFLNLWGLRGNLAEAFDGTYTGSPLNLSLPTDDTYDWGNNTRENYRIINSSWSALVTSTGSLQNQVTNINNMLTTTYLMLNGNNSMSGQFTTSSTGTIQGAAFSVGASTFSVEGGSVTANRLYLNTVLGSGYGGTGGNMQSAAQGAVPYFSATGVQSALAPGTAGQVLQSGGPAANPSWTSTSLTDRQGYVKDNFVGQVNGVNTVFSLSSTPTASGALQVVLDGLLQAATSDYTYSSAGQIVTMNVAPAANSYSFYISYSTGVTFIQTDGTNCSAGQAPRGVDAAGNSQDCFTAGDVVAASANAFSGANTHSAHESHTGATSFQGAVYISAASTVGPQGYASAVTKSSGTINNIMMIVASTNPTTGTSSSTLTNLEGGKMYELRFAYTQRGSAGRPLLRFNQGIGATDYKWTYDGINTNGGALLNTGDNSDESCQLSNSNPAVGSHVFGRCDVDTLSVSTATARCHIMVADDGNPHMSTYSTGCKYNSGLPSAVTSVQILTTSGSMDGKAYLRELIVP